MPDQRVPDPRLGEVLVELADLLGTCGQRAWATRLSALATDLDAADDAPARQDGVRSVLALCGGMGSFSDLVLQDEGGALPEQARFDRLRDVLADRARRELA